METHDPLCPKSTWTFEQHLRARPRCECDLIARARADTVREVALDTAAGIVDPGLRAALRDEVLADLESEVLALRDRVVVVHSDERPTASEGALAAYDRVLALLKGDGDAPQ